MSTTAAVTDILAEIRLKLDELEMVLADADSADERTERPVFDPDTDTPPITPWVDGSRPQRDWCALVLWASLRAINVRKGRGATHQESIVIAKAAGYQDGRGWNAWSAGWMKDENGDRWFTDDGWVHLRHYLDATGRSLPDDLA